MDLIQPICGGVEAGKNDVAVQLFTSTLAPKINLNTGRQTASILIYFTVHLTGIVKNYCVGQIDGLLSEQQTYRVTNSLGKLLAGRKKMRE